MASLDTKIVISATDATQGAFASAQSAMGKLAQSAASLGAGLSVGMFANWAKGLIDAADNINDLSQKIGISVRDLGGWQLAAESSGTSLETIGKGIKGLAPNITKFSKEFEALGISTKDPSKALIDLADIIAVMPDGFEKNALMVKLFGKAGVDLIPVLNMGSKGLAESAEKSADYAKQLAKLAPVADEFNDALKVLELRAKARSFSFLTDQVKGATGFLEFLEDATSGVKGFARGMDFLADTTPKWLGGIYLLAQGLNLVGKGLNSFEGKQGFALFTGLPKPEPEKATGEGRYTPAPPPEDPAVKENKAKGDKLRKFLEGGDSKAKKETYKDPLAAFRKQLQEANEKGEKELADFAFKTKEGITKINEATLELGLPPDVAERFKALAEIDHEFEQTAKRIDETTGKIDMGYANVLRRDAELERDKKKEATLGALDKKQDKSSLVKFNEDSQDFSHSLDAISRQYEEQIALVGLSAQEQDRLTIARNNTLAANEKIYAAERAQTPYTLEQQEQIRKSADESTERILASIEKRKAAEASWSNGAITGLKNYADSVSNVARSTESLIAKAFTGMEDALVKFVQTGKLNFTDLANSIVSDLIRIQVQQSVTKPLAEALSGGGIGNFLSGLFGSGGGASTAGPSAAAGGGSWLNMGSSLPSYAIGTDYVPYDMIAKIHQGERIVPAAENVPGNFSSGSGAITLNTTINAPGADAGMLPQIQSMIAAAQQQTLRAIPGVVQRQQLRNRITPMGT